MLHVQDSLVEIMHELKKEIKLNKRDLKKIKKVELREMHEH